MAWEDGGMDFEPHNSHFLSQIQNHETFNMKLDEVVRFKVILLPKNLFQMMDEMNDQFLPSKEANLRLFQRNEGQNENPLGCNLEAMKLCWSKIQKIQIQVGQQQYRPFQNDKILAKVEKPEFMDFERELYPASTEDLMNNILIDKKLAEERIIKVLKRKIIKIFIKITIF